MAASQTKMKTQTRAKTIQTQQLLGNPAEIVEETVFFILFSLLLIG